jgi:hypothetical protein
MTVTWLASEASRTHTRSRRPVTCRPPGEGGVQLSVAAQRARGVPRSTVGRLVRAVRRSRSTPHAPGDPCTSGSAFRSSGKRPSSRFRRRSSVGRDPAPSTETFLPLESGYPDVLRRVGLRIERRLDHMRLGDSTLPGERRELLAQTSYAAG